MRIILRSNQYIKQLTHVNNYSKSNLHKSKSYDHEEILGNKLFEQPKTKSFIEDLMKQVPKSKIAKNILKFDQEKQIAEDLQQDISEAYNNKVQRKKKTEINSSIKLKKKSQSETLSMAHSQNKCDIFEQYPALNFLDNALKSIPTEKQYSSQPVTKSPVNMQERNHNANTFMEIIEHSLPKEKCVEIIRLIQAHCKYSRSKYYNEDITWEAAQKEPQKAIEKKEKKLFQKVRKALEKQLAVSQKCAQERKTFISELLDCLRITNLFKISLREFRKKYCTEEMASQNARHLDIKISPNGTIFRQTESTWKYNAQKQAESQKYAYLYDLPYNLNKQESQELIYHIESVRDITIESFAIFPYKNIMQNRPQDIMFNMPENYKEEGKIQRIYNSANIDQYLIHRKKADRKKLKKEVTSNMDPQMKSLSGTADTILAKIKMQSYLKFNKSSMIIKFKSKAEKQTLLNPESRLFGLNFNNLQGIKIQEGTSKSMVTLSGIPVGCTSQKLIEELNKILLPEGILIEMEDQFYLTSHSINIEFQYFTDTIKAMELLNNLQFEGKKLKSQIKYGPSKLFKGQYILETQQNVEIVRKIIQIRDDYFFKFQQQDNQLKL